MRTNVAYPVSKAVQTGLVGGFVGALIIAGLAYMIPINGQPFFVAAAMLMGVSGTMAIAGGWALHLLTGLIIGAIFGVATTKVNTFRVTGPKRGLALGLGAGILVFLIFFLPMMMLSGMAAMLGSSLMPMAGGALAAHLVYGLILGGIVGVTLPKTSRPYKCQICGTDFQSQSELMQHARTHMTKATAAPEYECPTCGASFKSQTELMQHADKHKVLAR